MQSAKRFHFFVASAYKNSKAATSLQLDHPENDHFVLFEGAILVVTIEIAMLRAGG